MTQIAQVEHDQQQPLGNERGKERHDAKVPDFPGVQICNARGPLGKEQGQQNANGSQRAIRRNKNCADVEENWMHQSKNTAFALSGVARG